MRRLCRSVLSCLCGLVVACGGESNDDEGSPAGAGDYAAFYVAGSNSSYTRIAVRKVDVEGDRCTNVSLIAPAVDTEESFSVTLPATWGVEHAEVFQGSADCLTVYQLATEPEFAASGAGSAAWSQAASCPSTVDIDVTLEFAQELPWAPAEDALKASGIPVQGC